MTAQNRTVLKSYFETGDKPTQTEFSDLIDSFVLGGGDASAYINSTVLPAASEAALKVATNLEIGVDVQAFDETLTALGGTLTAANKIPYAIALNTAGELDFKDEDNMASDSATAIPSQQSVKAYVDDHTRFKAASFTYDLTTATGTQAITGVGFQPDFVQFFGAISGGSATWFADGVDDAVVAKCLANNPTTSTVFFQASNSITAFVTSSDNQSAKINSMDSDGFTLGWTKAGSPTGTLSIIYKAYKL